MPEMTTFEQRLAGRLVAEVARAPRRFDPTEIARSAMGRRSLRDRLLNAMQAGEALPIRASRKGALIAIASMLVLVAVALAVGASGLGGPRLVLLRTNGDVVVANADGSGQRVVGRLPYSALRNDLAWAPGGDHLTLFGDDWRLTIIDQRGQITASRQLEDRGSQFAWSPDGRRLAIYDGPLSNELTDGPPLIRPHLSVIDANGDVQWTAGLPSDLRYSTGLGAVAWSRDGMDVAITGFRFDPDNPPSMASFHSSLWLVDAETHAVRQAGPEQIAGGDYMPAWLPDGRVLVMRHHTGLVAIDPNTGAESVEYRFEPAEGGSGFMHFWAVSPDGSRVAMVAPGVGLAVLDLATGAVTKVPATRSDAAGGPPIRWNWDGTALVTRWGEVTDEPFFATQLASIDPETGEVTVLASDVVEFGVRN